MTYFPLRTDSGIISKLYGRIFLIIFLLTAAYVYPLEWYSSDKSGILLKPLSTGKVIPQGWCVSVDKKNNTETRTVFYNGKINCFYIYTRRDGKLVSVEKKDADGNPVSGTYYSYNASGNVNFVYIKSSAVEKVADFNILYSSESADTSVKRIYEGSGDNWIITGLDNNDLTVNIKEIREGTVYSETNFQRDKYGRLRGEIILSGDVRIIRKYNSDENIVEQQTYKNNILLENIKYTWRNNRIVRAEIIKDGNVSVTETVWNRDRKVSETVFMNGSLSKKTEWKNSSEKTETLYASEKVFVKTYWKNGKIIKKEFYSGGILTNIREAENFEKEVD